MQYGSTSLSVVGDFEEDGDYYDKESWDRVEV